MGVVEEGAVTVYERVDPVVKHLSDSVCRMNGRQTRSLRSPEATAALSHNVSQMSGDEAKSKAAPTQFSVPENQ